MSLLPHLSMGPMSRLALSGSHGELGISFNDSQAGIGSENIGVRPGYHVIINHEYEELMFGQTTLERNIGDGIMFVDKNSINTNPSGSNAFLLNDVSITASLSPLDRCQSNVALGQLNGIVEVFPIRKKIDFTVPLSYDKRESMQADLSNEPLDYSSPVTINQRPNIFIVQEQEVPGNGRRHYSEPISPFNDRRVLRYTSGSFGRLKYPSFTPDQWITYNINWEIAAFNIDIPTDNLNPPVQNITDLPIFLPAGATNRIVKTVITSSQIKPFADESYIEARISSIFSSEGRGLTNNLENDSEFKNILFNATGSAVLSMFDKNVYGTTSGFEYAISYHTGWNMGTDSIVYGGLKK